MMFMAYRRSNNSRGMKGLLKVFYRDGVFYFITLSGESYVEDHVGYPSHISAHGNLFQPSLSAISFSTILHRYVRHPSPDHPPMLTQSSHSRTVSSLPWYSESEALSITLDDLIIIAQNSGTSQRGSDFAHAYPSAGMCAERCPGFIL